MGLIAAVIINYCDCIFRVAAKTYDLPLAFTGLPCATRPFSRTCESKWCYNRSCGLESGPGNNVLLAGRTALYSMVQSPVDAPYLALQVYQSYNALSCKPVCIISPLFQPPPFKDCG
jgi:hypothetical protein